MVEPSSAQTRPSHRQRKAPAIQPSSTPGPASAESASGIVTNGPMPIMFSTFADRPPQKPIARGGATAAGTGPSVTLARIGASLVQVIGRMDGRGADAVQVEHHHRVVAGAQPGARTEQPLLRPDIPVAAQ